MNKSILGAIVAVLAVGGILLVVNANKPETSRQTPGSNAGTTNQTEQDNNSDAQTETKPAAANEVTIKDFAFAPQKITVKKGTTVTWTNQDDARHDITPDSDGPDFKTSELLAKGESYSFTFNAVGTYSYHCSPHPYMKATVEVTE